MNIPQNSLVLYKNGPARVAALGDKLDIELEDGRIARYREVFDRGMALVQQNFAPERIAKVLRKHAAALKADPAWAGHLPPPAAH